LPVLIGVFVGAPLISRELESGTYRFTWTQGVGRRRQVVLSIAVFAVVVALGTCLLGLLADSYAHPFEVIGAENHWISRIFEDSPAVLVAWSLFALAAGTLAGALIGRTVAAMAAATAVLGACAVFSYQLVTWLLSLAPIVRSGGVPLTNVGTLNTGSWTGFGPPQTWLVRAWFTGPHGAVLSEGQAINLTNRMYSSGVYGSGVSPAGNPARWLAVHHYVFFLAYQPASHYWIFQSIEVAILLALGCACAAAVIWFIHARRA
jgi:ABC-type transport system involved in multi-copper enzyme maturation permease subunit